MLSKTVPDPLILKYFQVRGDHEIWKDGIFLPQIVGHMAAISETEAGDIKVDVILSEFLTDLI